MLLQCTLLANQCMRCMPASARACQGIRAVHPQGNPALHAVRGLVGRRCHASSPVCLPARADLEGCAHGLASFSSVFSSSEQQISPLNPITGTPPPHLPPQTVKTLLNGWIGKISLFRKRHSVFIESAGNGDHLSKVGVRNQWLGAWVVACGCTLCRAQQAVMPTTSSF